jgi:hypothetical protein
VTNLNQDWTFAKIYDADVASDRGRTAGRQRSFSSG